jgi:hypothetical protein
MGLEKGIIEDLTQHGYHPRSSKHSDIQSDLIIKDLVNNCPLLRERALRGEVVAKLRHHQKVGYDDWVIDIAIGTCAGYPVSIEIDQSIRYTEPAIIQIAIELKSIYTEHKKARKNRLRDFNAFHGYAHQYDPKTVAAAFLLVNCSEYFYSPLRSENDITKHGGPRVSAKQIAQDSLDIFRTIPFRNSSIDPPGIEAIGVIVIEHDNLISHPNAADHKHIHRPTRFLSTPPAPRVGDPLHYQTMLQRTCQQYTTRFR